LLNVDEIRPSTGMGKGFTYPIPNLPASTQISITLTPSTPTPTPTHHPNPPPFLRAFPTNPAVTTSSLKNARCLALLTQQVQISRPTTFPLHSQETPLHHGGTTPPNLTHPPAPHLPPDPGSSYITPRKRSVEDTLFDYAGTVKVLVAVGGIVGLVGRMVGVVCEQRAERARQLEEYGEWV
jgi:hypothetical protein